MWFFIGILTSGSVLEAMACTALCSEDKDGFYAGDFKFCSFSSPPMMPPRRCCDAGLSGVEEASRFKVLVYVYGMHVVS